MTHRAHLLVVSILRQIIIGQLEGFDHVPCSSGRIIWIYVLPVGYRDR
jgi:hypothetical protein